MSPPSPPRCACPEAKDDRPADKDAAPPAVPSSPTIETRAPAIDVATQPGDEDEFDIDDEPFGGDGVTSLTSSVYACTFERGRRYHCFKNARYPIPNDDIEKDREDLKHAMLMELTDGVLFYSPVTNPQHIIDCGTGTGIWAIEVADRFPSAHVLGIDLTPIQPLWVPPNVEFLVDDCYQDWLSDETADLVHFRFMAIVLRDIPCVLAHAYKSLRPGGWIEFQELQGLPYCDDGTMSDDDSFKRLYEIAREAYSKFGMSTTIAAELEPYLRDAGFTNIHCRVLKVPIGVWARDETMRLIGLYQKTAVVEFISTFAGRPFEALGIPAAEIQLTLAMARKALEDTSVHRLSPTLVVEGADPE
ncbi:methyltransferase [Hirsutella rhossiliensis]|uniref:Methyltransferase domain-containing protein n=1 Tax=Hirsutella rhossiliensis TaxID=111463 RepID=A0A9P8N3C7_9HYPO|nr:methyltransferase domain-containing protein [Hirsutella rhossiliensis]KAH0966070.1 methyltransferase domain-containing protein [Hirsutella rhossiliensis]